MTLKQKLASLLLIAFCFLFPHFGGGILIYPIVVSVIVFLYLRLVAKENLGDLFFSFKRFELASVVIGLAGAICLSAFFKFAWDPLIDVVLPGETIDLSDFASIRGNLSKYLFVLLLAFIVGGFYEEIIFHGFIFTRLEKIIPGRHT